MKGRLVVSVVLLALIGANAQSEQGYELSYTFEVFDIH